MITATAQQLATGLWCVYDHIINGQVVFSWYCQLEKLFLMTDARNNTAWQTVTASEQPITIQVIALGTKIDMMKQSAIRVKALKPYCNVSGYNVKGMQKRIKCHTNGVIYQSQLDACAALGLSQSQLSRHLRGDGKQVKGLQFSWV